MVFASLSSVIPLRAGIHNSLDPRLREDDNEKGEDNNEENGNRYTPNQGLDSISRQPSSPESNAFVVIQTIFWMATSFGLAMTALVVITARFLRSIRLDQ